MPSMQRGLSLAELMVALAIGLLLILAACALLLATRSAYLLNDDRARLQQSGRFALEMVTRAVRQAGWRDWSAAGISGVSIPALAGLDARGLKSAGDGIAAPWQKPVNGSDVLALHFDGADDGSMQNCAGAAVPAAGERGWSIFHVAEDAGGEPELRCKYRGPKGWASDAIARGVESFQVLYGVDAAGAPRQYLNASAIDAAALWPAVSAVKFALLVRGAQKGRPDNSSRYELFGADYAREHPEDLGATIDEATLPDASRGLARRIFSATIELRNRALAAP
jgi:type IV pilus assembly protein PilW